MTEPLAIVTGGTRGLGLAFTRRLAKRGHHVLALYHSDVGAASSLGRELPHQITALRVDLRDFETVEDLVGGQIGRHGPPVVVVNNAGVNIDRPFLQMSAADWSTVIDTNLTGVFHLTRAVAPSMMSAGGGCIVNVAATTGIRPRRDGANYCASKAGLLQLTKCLALELAPAVRVNALIPGMTETGELVKRYALHDKERRSAVEAEIPQRRIGSVDDIADALEFLVGASSSYMTGQRLIVDGGQFMW